MNVALRHLRYFVAVAEELHFGRAAERIGVAQPALSQQVRRLEGLVGTELLARSTRSVALTPAGEALLPHARQAIAEADRAVAAAGRAARGEIGHITVGFIETAAVSLVPAAVRSFRGRHPGVDLTLRELPVDAQLAGLRTGSLDLAIVRGPLAANDLEVEPVADYRLLAAVPATHRFAGAGAIAVRELAEEPLVVLSREAVPGLYDQVIALLTTPRHSARIAQEVNSIPALLGLVAAGLGIAVMPDAVRSLSREGVRFVALEGGENSVLLAARRPEASPLVTAFCDAARAAPGATAG